MKIDKDNEVVNDEINKILLRRNKSHDFNLDNNIQNQFRISNNNSHFFNNISFDDTKSEDSDYPDISSKPLLLQRANKKRKIISNLLNYVIHIIQN